MSLKMKLTSAIVMFMLILSTLVIGVIAAESQTIKLYGNVTFNVNDTSLFVKSVSIRQSETDDYVPLDDFLPGYVDENMNINLGPHEISYSSFSLRFDVINRTAETYVAGGVTLPSSLSSQVSASASGTINPTTKPLGSNNMADISITDDPDGQIIVTVTSTIAQTINLDGTTVSIILQPEVLEGYTFSGNTLTGYTGSETEITIPSSYSIFNGQYVEGDDYQVTTIDTTGFTNRANITSITLPSTVTSIGNGVTFDNWTSLSAINVASGNTTYSSENGVLYNADKTTLIRYPEGLQYAGDTLPSTVTTIGDYACYRNFTYSIIIPASVVTIGNYAFAYVWYGDTYVIDFAENGNLTTIGHYAFYGTSLGIYGTALGTVTIPKGVTSIGNYAFANTSVAEIIFPTTIDTFDPSCILDDRNQERANLKKITIPEKQNVDEYFIYNHTSAMLHGIFSHYRSIGEPVNFTLVIENSLLCSYLCESGADLPIGYADVGIYLYEIHTPADQDHADYLERAQFFTNYYNIDGLDESTGYVRFQLR